MSLPTALPQPGVARLVRRLAPLAVAVPVLVAGAGIPAAAWAAPSSAAAAYEEFCTNNSDLCTVTARAWNPYFKQDVVLTCMLDAVATHCPSGSVVIDGPYHR